MPPKFGLLSPHHITLINSIESVQRSFTKRLPGFFNKSYIERLTLLNLQSLEHRRLIHDLILCYNIIHNRIAITQNDFFQLSSNTNTRGHPFKLTIPLTRTNLRKYFFSSRVIPIWNSLPANIVNASTSSLLKKLISGHDLSLFLHNCD